MYRLVLAVALSLTLAAPLVVGQSAFADGGDFSLDFVASAPFTYDHSTGGGAYDDRTIGKNLDVVESLEGGDFACTERVSFLTQIQVDAGATDSQTIELTYGWTADTTGQSGAALDEMVSAAINYGVIAEGEGEGPGGTDAGIDDDGGSVATIVATDYSEATFSQGAEHSATVRVTDLDPGESLVLRFEINIACNGQSPTGNLQARLDAAEVIAPAGQVGTISAGDQTIPFKRVAALKPPPK
jgi:hypothetical protein